MRRMNSLIYLKRARQAAERGDLECCISSYVKGFYLRCTASGFFDIEFSSLSHSPFDIQADGEWNLLKDLRIDFREKRTPFLSA